jgi:hypothetical protein
MKTNPFLKNIIVSLALAVSATAEVKLIERTSTYEVYRCSGGYPEAFGLNLHMPAYKPCKGDLNGSMCEPDDLSWMTAAKVAQFMDARPDTGSPYCGAVLVRGSIKRVAPPAPVIQQAPPVQPQSG